MHLDGLHRFVGGGLLVLKVLPAVGFGEDVLGEFHRGYLLVKYLRVSIATATTMISPLTINCRFGSMPIKVRP